MVIYFKKIVRTQGHTDRIDCSPWTTRVVGKRIHWVVVYKLPLWGHLHPSKAPPPQGAPSHSLESVKPNLKTLGSQKGLPVPVQTIFAIYAST